MHESPLVLVAKMGHVPDGIKSTVGGHVFMFDSIHFPEQIGPFEINPALGNSVPWLKLKQMIPLKKRQVNIIVPNLVFINILFTFPELGQGLSGFV